MTGPYRVGSSSSSDDSYRLTRKPRDPLAVHRAIGGGVGQICGTFSDLPVDCKEGVLRLLDTAETCRDVYSAIVKRISTLMQDIERIEADRVALITGREMSETHPGFSDLNSKVMDLRRLAEKLFEAKLLLEYDPLLGCSLGVDGDLLSLGGFFDEYMSGDSLETQAFGRSPRGVFSDRTLFIEEEKSCLRPVYEQVKALMEELTGEITFAVFVDITKQLARLPKEIKGKWSFPMAIQSKEDLQVLHRELEKIMSEVIEDL